MKAKGLSLVELLIVIGVMTVVGVLLMVIIVNSAGLFTKESAKLQEGLNINDILVQVRSNIKNAGSIVGSYTSGSTTYTTGTTQLILQLSSLDSSNNIIPNTFDYYVYFLDLTRLRFKTFPDAASVRKAQDQIFSNIIDSLKFQYFDPGTPPTEVTPTTARKIRMTVTLKRKTTVNSYETNIATSEGNLRND